MMRVHRGVKWRGQCCHKLGCLSSLALLLALVILHTACAEHQPAIDHAGAWRATQHWHGHAPNWMVPALSAQPDGTGSTDSAYNSGGTSMQPLDRHQQPQQQQHVRKYASWMRRLLGTVPFPGPGDPTVKPDPDMPGHFQHKWFQVLNQQWKDYYKSLEAIRLGNTTLSEVVSPLALSGGSLSSPAQLRRSIGYRGAMHRLRRVLHDLQTGKPIKLSVLGGSISWGSAVERGEDDWFSLLTKQLNSSFPKSKVTGRNGCVPATPSSFMNMCLEEYMDEDVDLVFLEYATNDGWDLNSIYRRKTYERLMRKVLNKPNHPAVVLVQLPTVGMAFSSQHKEKARFHHTLEDAYGLLAAYYDTPYLSMRNAIWRLAELHHYQMNFTHYFGMTYDFVHPLEPGHALVAQMVLFLMQEALMDLHFHPWSTWDQEEVSAPLPPPMYAGNWEEVNRLCRHGKAFKAVVTGNKGWSLMNEGDGQKPKYGYVTHEAGSKLEISLNTTRGTKPELKHVNVQIAYLRSYRDMGIALVRCHSGCKCPDIIVDAHHQLRQSTIFLLRINPSQSPVCKVTVTVQQHTHSTGHKFKVTGVMVNEFRDHADPQTGAQELLNKEDWLGVVNKGDGEARETWAKAAQRHKGLSSAVGSNRHSSRQTTSSRLPK